MSSVWQSVQGICSMGSDQPKFLEGIGSSVVSLTYYTLRKSRQLPCLVGPVIAVVEDIVGPHLQPLATSVENRGIYYLSLADEQVCFLPTHFEYCFTHL